MNTIGWGLAGCGDISRKRVAPALRDIPACDFVGVVRADSARAEAFAKEFGARRWYRTFEDMLTDSEIKAVYIATPVYLHCEQTIAAAEAGKPVLCEKPMGMTVAECDRMIAAVRANGVTLGIAYYRHFYPVLTRIKAILASGEIGKPVLAQINAFEYFDPAPDSGRHWFIELEKSGGGPLFDFGCHRIEVLLNVFGGVSFVRGFTDTLVFDRRVEDTGAAFFRFASGTDAVLTVTHASFEPQDTLDIYGTAGSIHVPVLNKGTLTVTTREGARTEEHPPHANIHLPLIEDFTNAVLEGRAPEVGGEIGREVNRIEEEIFRERCIPMTRSDKLSNLTT